MTALSPPPSGTLPRRCRPRPYREGRDAGSAAVELTLLAPLLILLLLLVVAAGRQVQARLLVDAAARQAARAATASRSPVQAARAADS
uniref:TadE/TadG family type IV pilus assembly protein n=1 Tax=Frankia sp. CiP3 TaxID=2880971 RepID=UPI001EF46B16